MGGEIEEDGIEEGFRMEHEMEESVETAYWIGEFLVYINAEAKLNYLVGSKSFPITKLSRKMMILGYIGTLNRLYLIDKSLEITSYQLLEAVIRFQTQVINRNITTAKQVNYYNLGMYLDSG